jgi:hypothetical protein
MQKLDLKKELKYLYAPSAKEVQVVDVPEFPFIMIDARIEAEDTPGDSQAFQQAMGALYNLGYTLKFMSKQRQHEPIDYTVMAVEGLWWTESGEFDWTNREAWLCTLLMMQPEHITADMFEQARQQALAKQAKKGEDNPALERVRFEHFCEGLCLQIMHVGPYAEEPRTVALMQAFAREKGYVRRGKHHEIYLGDPRRTDPARLKTVLRQPVTLAQGS